MQYLIKNWMSYLIILNKHPFETTQIQPNLVPYTPQKSLSILQLVDTGTFPSASTRADLRASMRLFLALIEPSPSIVRTPWQLSRVATTPGSLRKLPITLFYCMQVTERISRSGVQHSSLRGRGTRRGRSGLLSRKPEKDRGSTERAENESKRA